MNYIKVKSNNIDEVAYDQENKVLFVRFKNGGHYSYENVSKELYEELMKAESKGKFFHANIRAKHKATKL